MKTWVTWSDFRPCFVLEVALQDSSTLSRPVALWSSKNLVYQKFNLNIWKQPRQQAYFGKFVSISYPWMSLSADSQLWLWHRHSTWMHGIEVWGVFTSGTFEFEQPSWAWIQIILECHFCDICHNINVITVLHNKRVSLGEESSTQRSYKPLYRTGMRQQILDMYQKLLSWQSPMSWFLLFKAAITVLLQSSYLHYFFQFIVTSWMGSSVS